LNDFRVSERRHEVGRLHRHRGRRALDHSRRGILSGQEE
jgi:hypothetical protein